MKMTKKQQNGLLLALYLDRSGMAAVQDVADELQLSYEFLAQIAVTLRKAGVLLVKRGPGGGYELKAEATVGHVVRALGALPKSEEVISPIPEVRALGLIYDSLRATQNAVLRVKIRSFNVELAAGELEMLNYAKEEFDN